MDFSPDDGDCQCQPDIISAAALMQTCFAQVGLGRGQEVKGEEEERVLQWLLLFFWCYSFFSLVLLTWSLCCRVCLMLFQKAFCELQCCKTGASQRKQQQASLCPHSHTIAINPYKSWRNPGLGKTVFCQEEKTDEDFRWSWSQSWSTSLIRLRELGLFSGEEKAPWGHHRSLSVLQGSLQERWWQIL